MPKKKVVNEVNIVSALENYGKTMGITKEEIHTMLCKALEESYIYELTGGPKHVKDMPNPVVKVELDPETALCSFYIIKKVTSDVQDDMLEIEPDDAIEATGNKEIKEGDEVSLLDKKGYLSKLGNRIVNNCKIKLRHLTKKKGQESFSVSYKNKIGEILIGTVDSINDRYVTIVMDNDCKIDVIKKNLIPNEIFKIGDRIRVYIYEYEDRDGHKIISPSRTHPGFVKRLFEEQVPEVYDGTITIKDVVRNAGRRSKIAVYSKDPDVDSVGSCIGHGGIRINEIRKSLGDKEIVDIIPYSDDKALYVAESLRPIEVVAVHIDSDVEGDKSATCVIKDDSLEKAKNLFFNTELAERLCGFDISIITETEAASEDCEFLKVDELRLKDKAHREALRTEEYLQYTQEKNRERKDAQLQEELDKVAAYNEALKAEANAKKAAAKVNKETKANKPSEEKTTKEVVKPAAPEQPRFSTLEEELAKYRKSQEKAVEHEEQHVEIQTTTSALDIEKQLEAEKEKEKKTTAKKSSAKKPATKKEEEVKPIGKPKAPKETRSVYTEEELAEMEAEDLENEDVDDISDEDFEDYDEYYDDDK